MNDTRSNKMASVSFWGEKLETPIRAASIPPFKLIMNFNSSATFKFKNIKDDYMIFDFSEFVPQEMWDNGKTNHPSEKWMATVLLQELIAPKVNIVLYELKEYLKRYHPEKEIYTMRSYGNYYWIE